MSVADSHLAQFAEELSGWDQEFPQHPALCDPDLPQSVRDALALSDDIDPIVPIAIKFGADQSPGKDPAADAEWAASVAYARRDVLSHSQADDGLRADSLRLLDRVDTMLGQWGSDWNKLVAERVADLVDAGRRGRQRGQQLRDSGMIEMPVHSITARFMARHPSDHFLSQAISTITDEQCRSLIAAQIARMVAGYERIRDLDWSDQEAAADAVVEVLVLDGQSGSWTRPVRTQVTDVVRGSAVVGRELGVRLVADPAASFNGTWAGVVTGERWRICATTYPDGTVLPADGTRRLATA